MSSKRLSTMAVKQQRRGTSVAQRTSAIDEIIAVYPTATKQFSTGSGDSSRRISWIDKVRNRGVVLSSKGRIVRENYFSTDYRGIFSLRFAPDGDKLVTAYGVGSIQVWHAETDNHCITVKTAPDHGDPITSIRFLPNSEDNKFFAAGTAGTIFLCSMNAGDYQDFARETPNEINALDVDGQGDTVVTVGKDASLRLYDIYTKKIKIKLGRDEELHYENDVSKFHRTRVFAVRFHPDNKEIFMSAGWDDCVKIWDARVKDGYVRQFRGPHICGDALDIHGNTILTGSWKVDKSLQLWDFLSGKLINTITPINRPLTIDGEFLYCCQFFKGDFSGKTVVCGGSGGSCVEVIDISVNRIISNFKNHKSVQAIDTTTKFVAFGGMESVLKVATVC